MLRYEKLSANLAVAVDDFQRTGRSGLEPHRRSLGLVSVAPAAKPPRVVVFIHTDVDGGADFGELSALGIEVNAGRGPIRTGIVPLGSLESLSEHPAVRRIVPARRLSLMLDAAVPAVKVPQLRQSRGLSGRGTVIGIVDTGIEAGHPSFGGRVMRIWDQTMNGSGVPEGAYGVELAGPMLSLSRDTVGHGTHVAGIAAGADETYGGVAPEADLLIVKSDLLTAHIADGIRYVFRVAADLGRPAVVNLSLGGHGDAHDGTDSLSAVLDEAVGPGRIVCCAAGNEGNDNVHARVLVREGRTRTIACTLMRRGVDQPPFVAGFNGWYPGEDRLAVAVVAPSGEQTPFQPVITDGSPVREYSLPQGSVRIITPGPDPDNGDHNFLVLIEAAAETAAPPPAPPPPGGAWRIRVEGEKVSVGTVDVWSIDSTAGQFTGRTVVDSMKVGSPGSATGAVTVASYTTKDAWDDVFGEGHRSGLELDDISDFSSEGPRRDGVEKPDVAAPGAMVTSALSVHSGVTPGQLVDDRHTIMAGTSMASPFVAGLVALLLQGDPDLEPKSVKDLLRAHSAVPGQPPGTFDPKWGYGLVDAERL